MNMVKQNHEGESNSQNNEIKVQLETKINV